MKTSKTINRLVMVGDFETTVFPGQTYTEVWAAAVVEMGKEDVQVFNSISALWSYLLSLNRNITIYYHNLKFDGSFWLDYLARVLKYKPALEVMGDTKNFAGFPLDVEFVRDKDMRNKQYKYIISDMGQWYSIKIKTKGHIIELRDSLKLIPLSVDQIGKSYGTKHRKLSIEYGGMRCAGGTITAKEREYISNDVLVVKEALEIMFSEGHNKLTIGSCCLSEYKSTVGKEDWAILYPDLTEYKLSEEYGAVNADAYIRKSYKGGWCYLVPGKANKRIHNGITCDVNSLYPSVMHSESGSFYPIGQPRFWRGNYIPDGLEEEGKYYFIRIRTRFYLKPGYLPFIQMKNTLRYAQNENLTTSDIIKDGQVYENRVELTLTKTDWALIREHYDLVDCEILDGCYFFALKGIFDDYINKYRDIKMSSKGGKRQVAKLFLNNLYGKMAASDNSSFKVAYLKPDKVIGFYTVPAHDKKPGYIAVGSVVTSYARNFTIRAAQKNYHGPDCPGFIYADTDSIHCDIGRDKIAGIEIHPTAFCCWKVESEWDTAIFVRQKTYIEHVVVEDGEPVDPYYNIKCAGMPAHCKKLLNLSLQGKHPENPEKYRVEELDFISVKRELEDFKIGLSVPGKLLPHRILGGIVLQETTFEMH